ncbi:MAG: hypothetical protein M0Z55_05855 [Peptococcaceae bacterium]|nr:hypothetical protein [Peptococcaceae bacterium]
MVIEVIMGEKIFCPECKRKLVRRTIYRTGKMFGCLMMCLFILSVAFIGLGVYLYKIAATDPVLQIGGVCFFLSGVSAVTFLIPCVFLRRGEHVWYCSRCGFLQTAVSDSTNDDNTDQDFKQSGA